MLTFWPVILLCIVLRATFAHFQQRVARQSQRPAAANILMQFTAAMVGFAAFLVFDRGAAISFSPRALLLWAGSSVSYALFNRSQIYLRQHQDNGRVLIFNEFSNILMVAVGIAVFQEALTPARVFGAGFILLATVVLQWQRGKLQPDQWLWLNGLSVLLVVSGMTLEVLFIRDFNIPLYLGVDWLLQCLFLMTLERVSPRQLQTEFREGPRRDVLLAGCSWSLAILFALMAYRLGDVSVVTPLRTASILVSLVGSYLWLGERSRLPQKFTATALLLTGVSLIARSR